jgi:hypothetical protein
LNRNSKTFSKLGARKLKKQQQEKLNWYTRLQDRVLVQAHGIPAIPSIPKVQRLKTFILAHNTITSYFFR